MQQRTLISSFFGEESGRELRLFPFKCSYTRLSEPRGFFVEICPVYLFCSETKW